jgi:hypothetical protein
MNAYAVVWSSDGDRGSGRLESFPDHLELHGRGRIFSLPFSQLRSATIARRPADRLLGLPVLALDFLGLPTLRIASLEGAGFLQELADRVEAGIKRGCYEGTGT